MNIFIIGEGDYCYYYCRLVSRKPMLYVETNNCNQQRTLQEEFSRDGDLFAVPIKKTSHITQLIQSISFEIFSQQDSPSSPGQPQPHPLHPLTQKLTTLIQNTLKLTISLSEIRQIFQLIKTHQVKLTLYQDYILQMNRHFMDDLDAEEGNDDEERGGRAGLWDVESQFQEELVGGRAGSHVLDVQFVDGDGRIGEGGREGLEVCLGSEGKNRRSIISIDECKYGYSSPTDEDAQTMHTLKSQITTSPKFSLTPFSEMQAQAQARSSAKMQTEVQADFDSKKGTNYKIDKLNCSFHYSEREKEDQYDLVNVKDECRMDSNTNSIFYCPEWKKNQEDQKKVAKSFLPEPPKKLSSNDSNYIENLSGRVHPVPSFLHDDSLGQMIVKEKREDVRKSIILKKSMHGIEENKQATNDHTYSSNLRLIKFHNKLRRNSKKSLGSKKDLQQVRAAQQEFEESQAFIKDKEKNAIYQSDDKLPRGKQKLEEIEHPKAKMDELIESKLKVKKEPERKISNQVKAKTGSNKAFNFFKAKRQ